MYRGINVWFLFWNVISRDQEFVRPQWSTTEISLTNGHKGSNWENYKGSVSPPLTKLYPRKSSVACCIFLHLSFPLCWDIERAGVFRPLSLTLNFSKHKISVLFLFVIVQGVPRRGRHSRVGVPLVFICNLIHKQ